MNTKADFSSPLKMFMTAHQFEINFQVHLDLNSLVSYRLTAIVNAAIQHEYGFFLFTLPMEKR
ncbi:CLUMA_CG000700, isoform A [Clunio marinus]|uniref:CLUMA_CG000700, isoform A n=1 Tax=Clunio marinus TaxID=568069 RepID=A0A1J1HG80_9DIPT|nr:CLUMA_CG000700, isoform A [Clunio marinus]